MEKPNKSDLRKKFLTKRNKLTPVARARDSAIIRQRVFGLQEWRDAHTILAYVSFRSEVDTHKLIQEALQQEKRVVLPVIDPQSKEITFSELRAWGDLAPGVHGIYEPGLRFRKRVDPSEIELVLVPGLAFDRTGGRIGWGGGYFDKLLATMPKARRVALAFSAQVQQKPLPLQDHDMLMNTIITEKEILTLL